MTIMRIKKFLVLIAMTMIMAPLSAQVTKLSEAEIKNIVEQMEDDWRFAYPMVRWLQDEASFDFYVRTAPGRTPEELQDVLDLGKECYEQSKQLLQVEKQVYPKPGRKKSEASLAQYFKDPEKAKERMAAARVNVKRYEAIADMFPRIIEGTRNMTYKVPEGALVSFEYYSRGGMMREPGTHVEVRRQQDGSYLAFLDTWSFNKLDTVALSKPQVDHIRQLLIDGEIYKMPQYSDTPMLLLDGPSSSVSVSFEDADYSCSSYPPLDWGGRTVMAVNNYLRELHPRPPMTEEEREMLGR